MKNCLPIFIALMGLWGFSQPGELKPFALEVDYLYGTILEHNPDIGHLITGHPEGFVLKYSRKTYGLNDWERGYNYPDWGFSFVYQDMKNPHLGEIYSAYSHIGWYFLNRNLKMIVGTGITYATNPYHSDRNFLNNAYGSHVMSTTYLSGVFTKENIWNGLGMQAGFTLVHYSNGNFKPPNTSTNTFALSVGVTYQPDVDSFPEFIYSEEEKEKFSERVKLNLAFRFGLNESDVIGLGKRPFYILSVSADKKFNRKSSVMIGTEVFFSHFLKDLIHYQAIAYPELDFEADADYKRAGVFGGYELRFNKVATFVHLGYYFYYPYEFEGRIYNRLGIKRYFGQSENVFAIVNVRAHAAKAEAMEFGVGYRF